MKLAGMDVPTGGVDRLISSLPTPLAIGRFTLDAVGYAVTHAIEAATTTTELASIEAEKRYKSVASVTDALGAIAGQGMDRIIAAAGMDTHYFDG